MRVDDVAQLLVALVALGACDRDGEPHVAEAGSHGLVNDEQAARIQIGLGVDADVVDLNAERVLDGAGGDVVARESAGPGDEEGVLASADARGNRALALAADAVGELGGGRVGADALAPRGTRVGEARGAPVTWRRRTSQ